MESISRIDAKAKGTPQSSEQKMQWGGVCRVLTLLRGFPLLSVTASSSRSAMRANFWSSSGGEIVAVTYSTELCCI